MKISQGSNGRLTRDFRASVAFLDTGRNGLWSKKHLATRFPPGKGIHYTDTGYILLGMIIEWITSKQYAEVLHEYLFEPLQMNHSFLSHFSEPALQRLEFFVFQSYSCIVQDKFRKVEVIE